MKVCRTTHLMVLAAAVLVGCSSVTEIEGSWSNLSYTERPVNMEVVFVVGVQTFIQEATVESQIAKELQANGVASTTASDMFQRAVYDKDGDGTIDDPAFRDQALAKLRELGVDGVMVIAIKDIGKEERYVSGTVIYQPRSYDTRGWYDTWSTSYGSAYSSPGYYDTTYDRVETPGYTATDVNAYLETNLYSLQDDGLAWTAQTNSINAHALHDRAESFASKMVPAVIGAGVVRRVSS